MISVLLIDDDPELLNIISQELGYDTNFALKICKSPSDAIELALGTKFDAIVCDYYMPGMDGCSLLQHLRTRGCTAQLILYSGKEPDADIKYALTSCADAYVQRQGNPEAELRELKEIIYKATTARKQRSR